MSEYDLIEMEKRARQVRDKPYVFQEQAQSVAKDVLRLVGVARALRAKLDAYSGVPNAEI